VPVPAPQQTAGLRPHGFTEHSCKPILVLVYNRSLAAWLRSTRGL